MANTPEDGNISNMFRELDTLKAEGKASSEPTSEYMRKLYQLRDATSNRLSFAHTPRVADQEASQQYRAKQRTRDRHQARNLKYSVSL